MTSKLTRERLLEIAEDGFLKHGESKELASMALAALDSDPVAWTWHYREQWHVTNDERRAEFVAKDGDVAVLPLYRHAQTASAVPDAYVRDERGRMMLNGVCEPKIGFGTGWNTCRAAMLQELKKSAGTEAICRSNENAQAVEVQSLTSINPAPDLGSLQKKLSR